MKKHNIPENKSLQYVKGKFAARHLDICYTTLISLVRRGIIPSYKIGSSVRYKLSDLDKVIDEGYRDFVGKGGVK